MRTTLLSFLFLLILLPALGLQAKAGRGNMEDDILTLINRYRAKYGLQALKMNNTISDAARRHSKDMASGSIPFGHDGFDERTNKLIKQLSPADAAAENVAYGAETAQEVVNMWLHSKGHRKNIMGNYNLTGIGIAEGRDGTYYFTQIFIHKKG